MPSTDTLIINAHVLSTLLSDDAFWPSEPKSVEEAGLSVPCIESLICGQLAGSGRASGRELSQRLCLPLGVLGEVLRPMGNRKILAQAVPASGNDYEFELTEDGRNEATSCPACTDPGPAPVPLADYVFSVEVQSINGQSSRRHQLEEAVRDLSVDPELLDVLGPAVDSGADILLYGAPGNGKSTLARRITRCFGETIWLPYSVVADGEVIKLYDPACHETVPDDEGILDGADYDRRWIRVRRPAIGVGGELTLDRLEIRHDPHSNGFEAPLQMKTNCGCLLIDDFGRQRVDRSELLSRWMVPLESRHDLLSLPSGKKIQVPFTAMIIISTNLDPKDLFDEAFLRRIRYRFRIDDPSEEEFHDLFRRCAEQFECEYRREAVQDLIEKYYYAANRPMRRCHPRDLLGQMRNYCKYHGRELEMLPAYFDRAAKTYFGLV